MLLDRWIDVLILAIGVAAVAALIRQTRARKRRWRELISTITKPRNDESPREAQGRATTIAWREDRNQRIWLWIGVLFLAFYIGDACLFWGPNPQSPGPPLVHLSYWAAFGALLIGLVGWSARQGGPKKWLVVVQSIVLGVAITAAVVGVPALIIARTHDVTLGHAVLLFTLSLAAGVIGSLSYNLGWLLAGCAWALTGCTIFCICHRYRTIG